MFTGGGVAMRVVVVVVTRNGNGNGNGVTVTKQVDVIGLLGVVAGTKC